MKLNEIRERFERRLLDEKEIGFLLTQLEEMQKTLEWYADDSIWITTEIDGVYAIEPLEYSTYGIDGGPWSKARQTLQSLKGQTP